MKFIQLLLANIGAKICDTSNFKKAIDKSLTKGYNGIVNSKGAADDKSAAFYLFKRLIPYTKGCMTNQTHTATRADILVVHIVHHIENAQHTGQEHHRKAQDEHPGIE